MYKSYPAAGVASSPYKITIKGVEYPVLPGSSETLGGRFTGEGCNFALAAPTAAELADDPNPHRKGKVELCLFDDDGHEIRVPLFKPEGRASNIQAGNGIWTCFIPGLDPQKSVRKYGYRVYGPYEPEKNGNRFNPNKLLMDPYARNLADINIMLDALETGHQALFGYRRSTHRDPVEREKENDFNGASSKRIDRTDSAPFMAKSIIFDPRASTPFDWGESRSPETQWEKTVIYEGHVKGFTARHPDIPQHMRGKFEALAEKPAIRHLLKSGVTAFEALPIQFGTDDKYWGYNTLLFFMLNPAFGKPEHLKKAIRTLHDNGLEFIMDVVYNHTSEGNHKGPTLCYRGIDNRAYYMLCHDHPQHYMNFSGCGNSVDMTNPFARRLAIESLKWLRDEFHVDGFRFDLMQTLVREPQNGFGPNAINGVFMRALLSEPALKDAKLISESWDIGQFALGDFPIEEWNEHFRKSVRDFWSRNANVQALATALGGSSPHLDHPHKGPDPRRVRGINYIRPHDGGSLADGVAYSRKHNEGNGENNGDGNEPEGPGDRGVEGPTPDKRIRTYRLTDVFNKTITWALAAGIPMTCQGDEMGATHWGNTNNYKRDDESNWLNFPAFFDPDIEAIHDREIFSSGELHAIFSFRQIMLQLRWSNNVLTSGLFPHGKRKDDHGVPDITWWKPDGDNMEEKDWNVDYAHCLGMMHNNPAIHADGYSSQFPNVDENTRILTIVNSSLNSVNFTLPVVDGASGDWRLVVDTSRTSRPCSYNVGEQFTSVAAGKSYAAPAEAALIFVHESMSASVKKSLQDQRPSDIYDIIERGGNTGPRKGTPYDTATPA